MSDSTRIVAVMVGNTNTLIGVYDLAQPHKGIGETRRVANGDPELVVRAVLDIDDEAAIVIASVNRPMSEVLQRGIRSASDRRVFLVGEDLGIAIDHRLDAGNRTGQDRFLAACGAFSLFEQACVVVDAGTAVTVDFIDGTGVFQGGAIAPGARMALRSLSEGTSALPDIELRAPLDDPFGRDSVQAILNGVFYGIRGLVRMLTERYAEAYEAYPLIVATGGDAELLFGGDELIERIVPDLTLVGIAVTAVRAIDRDEDDDNP